MSEQKNNGILIGTKATRVEKDLKGRDKIKLTLGTPTGGPGAGVNQVTALIEALTPFVETGATLDIRTELKEHAGRKFSASFMLVKELGVAPATTEGKTTFESVSEGVGAQVDRVNESI